MASPCKTKLWKMCWGASPPAPLSRSASVASCCAERGGGAAPLPLPPPPQSHKKGSFLSVRKGAHFYPAATRLLPAAIQLIRYSYAGDAARIWRRGSSGAAVVRRFLAFDGVNTKIANMAANILIRDFEISFAEPMPDIAVDTHVLRVFERLGLLRRLEHSHLRSTKPKQQLRLQLRARELSPKWPGELDWPTWHIGWKFCHAGREPECGICPMESVCPRLIDP